MNYPDLNQVPAIWEVGDVILDLYEVRQVFTGGGMGLVYRVHHRGWNMDLAVKSPRPEFFRTQEQIANFEREAKTWVGLGPHPNIVSCYYVRRLGGIPRIFAEFVEGGTLSEWIQNRKLYGEGDTKTLQVILDIAVQVAWGLHFAHEQGLVHQDVKPSNVLMMPNGSAKVSDFGLANARNASAENTTTSSRPGQSILIPGSGLMTPEYASPEQAKGAALSRQTDVWSWAVSVLEMIKGEVDWMYGQAVPHVLEELYGDERKDDPIRLVISKCFSLKIENRASNLADLADELIAIFCSLTNGSYERLNPSSRSLLAYAHNNHALSLLDLGDSATAETSWRRGLETDPLHVDTVYNYGLHKWRTGSITDWQLVKSLRDLSSDNSLTNSPKVCLQEVHLERGDAQALADLESQSNDEVGTGSNIPYKWEPRNNDTSEWGGPLKTLEGMGQRVTSMALAKNSRQILTANVDSSICLWDLETGNCVRRYKQPDRHNIMLTFCGQHFFLSTDGTALQLSDLKTGTSHTTLQGHDGYISCVASYLEGQYAITGSRDMTLNVWDLSGNRSLCVLEGHLDGVTSVAVSEDGDLAVSGSWDKSARIWNLRTGDCVTPLTGHIGMITSVALSRDGALALSGSVDDTMRLWNTRTGECIRIFHTNSVGVHSVALSPDGTLAVAGTSDGAVQLWDIATGRCRRTFIGHQSNDTTVALSYDAKSVVSVGSDGQIKLWKSGFGGKASFLPSKPQSGVDYMRNAVEHDELAVETSEALARRRPDIALELIAKARGLPGYHMSKVARDLLKEAGRFSRRVGLSSMRQIGTLNVSSNGLKLLTASLDGRYLAAYDSFTIHIWDTASSQCIQSIFGQRDIWDMVLSVDGKYVVAAGEANGSVVVWNVATRSQSNLLSGHTSRVKALCACPTGRQIASASEDGEILIWSFPECEILIKIHSPEREVRALCFSMDGLRLFTEAEGVIRSWDKRTGQCNSFQNSGSPRSNLLQLSPDRSAVVSAAWSYEGNSPDVILDQCTLRVRTSDTLKEFKQLIGHTGSVSFVAFTADSRFIISGGLDKTVRVWDINQDRCIKVVESHASWILSMVLRRDGNLAFTASRGSGAITVWELDWEYEFPGWKDWDDGAYPYISAFIDSQRSRHPDSLSISEEMLKDIMHILSWAGYGWLRVEGVKRRLAEMTKAVPSN